MSQISPPIRILLVLTVAVLGVYMLFLRPKAEVIPPSEPAGNVQTGAPAQTGAGKAVEAAQGAANATNEQLKSEESVDGVDAGEAAAGTATGTKSGSTGAAAAAAAPAADLKGLPKPIAEAIRRDKILVILFWNGKSADDKAVHKALKKVHRWNGHVYVDSAPIREIAKYGRIARGVNVDQSPTVVVADRDLHAETLVGYVDAQTIDQAVVDAIRSTGPLFTDTYLRKLDAVCVRNSNAWTAMPNYYMPDAKVADKRIATASAHLTAFAHDVAAVKAPKKWQAFRTAAVSDLRAVDLAAQRLSTAVTPTSTRTSMVVAIQAFNRVARPATKRSHRRFDSEGLFRCGSAF